MPEFYRTGSGGPEIIGTFSFLDTVIIALHDTINNRVQYYNYPLMDGENNYSLNWNPSLGKNFDTNRKNRKLFKTEEIFSIDSIPVVVIPKENELLQNYPNPYN